MKNTSHLFFVIFFALVIAIQLTFNAMGNSSSYESLIAEYSAWVLFCISFAIWLTEKFNKVYLFFVFAGLFLITICVLQGLVLIETQELWYTVFRALLIPFTIYIYTTMFLTERWAMLKHHRNSPT